MTPAEVREWTERSRAASGLPPKIQDPTVLARLVTLAFAGEKEQGAADGTP